ncbi:kinase-like domain-containing protein [Mycena sp. CBHHK59/15]|nr:kinase-like domain-containing protein [Mycena sp. CBHHK59/15]
MPTADWDPSFDYPPSPSSTASSFDEEEVNSRARPYWPGFRGVLKLRGFRLETVQDVREFYTCSLHRRIPDSLLVKHSGDRSDALCPDAGLPDNLFRGTRTSDGAKVVIKAVHLRSREFEVIRFLTTPLLRDDPMNHCILDNLGFIVMEQWSSQLIDDQVPCCLGLFLAALRQCIEHCVFMHKHRVAHLDISLRNLLTDYQGNYAYIDYELSRRFGDFESIRIPSFRTTEVPPECELSGGDCPDAYKADVWALAVLILRACKLAGYCVAELVQLTRPMLNENPDDRPPMEEVLLAFDKMVPNIRNLDRLPSHH